MIIKEDKNIKITSPGKVYDVMSEILKAEHEMDRDKEHLWVIGLKANGVIKYIELVTLGLLDQSLVCAREVFRFSIMKAVKRIMVVHNHPSGECEPSGEDIKITDRLCEAGKLLDIKVLDHVVISESDYYSFRENGLIQ